MLFRDATPDEVGRTPALTGAKSAVLDETNQTDLSVALERVKGIEPSS
jgi:hypothetical protein